jgi:hypothetical protein
MLRIGKLTSHHSTQVFTCGRANISSGAEMPLPRAYFAPDRDTGSIDGVYWKRYDNEEGSAWSCGESPAADTERDHIEAALN